MRIGNVEIKNNIALAPMANGKINNVEEALYWRGTGLVINSIVFIVLFPLTKIEFVMPGMG